MFPYCHKGTNKACVNILPLKFSICWSLKSKWSMSEMTFNLQHLNSNTFCLLLLNGKTVILSDNNWHVSTDSCSLLQKSYLTGWCLSYVIVKKEVGGRWHQLGQRGADVHRLLGTQSSRKPGIAGQKDDEKHISSTSGDTSEQDWVKHLETSR